MNIEELREYCLSIKGAEECLPFDETTLVFKVMGKMFAYFSLEPQEGDFRLNVKCDPEKAIELRDQYSSVVPGYHANKRLWNTIILNGEMRDDEIRFWIQHSVDEVIANLPKKQQEIYRFSVADLLP